MKNKLWFFISAWAPPLVWALMIFKLSEGVVPAASVVYWQDFAVKKTGHVLLFGVLALLLFRAFRVYKTDKKTAAILAIIIATLYGATDEFHQIYTKGREPRVRDVFIDGVGAGVFTYVLYFLPERLSGQLYNAVEKLNLS